MFGIGKMLMETSWKEIYKKLESEGKKDILTLGKERGTSYPGT
jgi:hypothetical protein